MMNVAVVTGAGRGLGRLIARKLARKGYAVVATDIDEIAAADTAKQIGSHAWSLHHDVRDLQRHREVADYAAARGQVTLWINNAGVLHTAPAWEMAEDNVRRHVEVNVLGVMWGCHAALEVMESGHIINIASISALMPVPGLAVYAATKHAVLGYSLSLQGDLDYARRPIRVSAVCPDVMDTAMVHEVSHLDAANLLFHAKPLDPERVAEVTVGLVDRPRPRLTVVLPRRRGLLAHLCRPFPAVSLKVLAQFRKLGEVRRKS